jgi:hypothetical protein
MRLNKYIGILILIVTFFGVASQQQTTVANQEIVLQFTDIQASSQEAQNTLEIVKKQLQDLGVNDIKIKEEAGNLKITYYSDVNVTNVKEILSKGRTIIVDYAFNMPDEEGNTPSKNQSIDYNIDIYEIQNNNNIDLGLEGCVLENTLENHRYYDPNIYAPSLVIDTQKDDFIVKVSYRVWRHIEISTDNHSYIIPEVRAGPHAIRNS